MANPSILQNYECPGNNPASTATQTISQATPIKVTALSALVCFPVCIDFPAVHGSLGVSDTESNTWIKQNQGNSTIVTGGDSLAACTVAQAAGDPTSPMTVTSGVFATGDTASEQAFYFVEVANCNALPVIGQSVNPQNAAPAGATLVSGLMSISQRQCPCLLVSAAYNATANGSHPVPIVSGALTSLDTWAGFFTGTNTAAIGFQLITTAGNYQATFTQNSTVTEDCVVSAVILQGQDALGNLPSYSQENMDYF